MQTKFVRILTSLANVGISSELLIQMNIDGAKNVAGIVKIVSTTIGADIKAEPSVAFSAFSVLGSPIKQAPKHLEKAAQANPPVKAREIAIVAEIATIKLLPLITP